MSGILQYDEVFRKGCIGWIWELPGKFSLQTELKPCRNPSFFGHTVLGGFGSVRTVIQGSSESQ